MEEAYSGLNKKVNYTTYKKCSRCTGQGSEPGSKPITCKYCSGKGKARSNQGFFTIQQTCPECGGYGETISNPCKQCSGNGKVQSKESVSVKFLKVLMMGQELESLAKEKLEAKEDQQGICIYLFRLIIIIFLKDRMNIYISSCLLHLLMQR